MDQILIVEDDKNLNRGLCKALMADQRQLISCPDLKSARLQLLCGSAALVLLDINLLDGSGLDLLREIKKKDPAIPVILLTANDTDMDIVDGLEKGADDYITKPFSLSVLRARVNTQLRKRELAHQSTVVSIDHFRFDFEEMVFWVGDAKVELSKTEQKLLHILTRNPGRVISLSAAKQELQPVLEGVVEQYAPKAAEKGLSLELQNTETCAVFDPKWTAEALANLVDNAIKYTDAGGITILASDYEMFARVDIADTGIGIPESEQPRIFSRFYRSGNAAEQEGVGIGLFLARQIVTGEGGYLKVTSESGKGSVFSVFLPK